MSRHAVVTTPGGLTSAIVSLRAWHEAAVSRQVGENAFGPASATPYLTSAPLDTTPSWHVSLVVLSGDPVWPEVLADAVRVEVTGEDVRVEFPGDDVVSLRLRNEC